MVLILDMMVTQNILRTIIPIKGLNQIKKKQTKLAPYVRTAPLFLGFAPPPSIRLTRFQFALPVRPM